MVSCLIWDLFIFSHSFDRPACLNQRGWDESKIKIERMNKFLRFRVRSFYLLDISNNLKEFFQFHVLHLQKCWIFRNSSASERRYLTKYSKLKIDKTDKIDETGRPPSSCLAVGPSCYSPRRCSHYPLRLLRSYLFWQIRPYNLEMKRSGKVEMFLVQFLC